MTFYLIWLMTLTAGLAGGVLIGVHHTARAEAKRRIPWPIVGPVAVDVAEAQWLLSHLSEALDERQVVGFEFEATPEAESLYSLLERASIDPNRLPSMVGTLLWLSEYVDMHQPGLRGATTALPDRSTTGPARLDPASRDASASDADPIDRAASELTGLLLQLNHTGNDRAWEEDADRAWELLSAFKDLLIERGYRP